MATVQSQFSSDPNQIVTVQVSTVVAPIPNTYQQQGALVSLGGSKLTSGTSTYLTQYSDLTTYLRGSNPVLSAVWQGGVATFTVNAADLADNDIGDVNDSFVAVIAGFSPSEWNGAYNATVTSPTTFTVVKSVDPGTVTTLGTFQTGASIELDAMARTFFAQGSMTGVSVLELGEQDRVIAYEVAALSTWMTSNPLTFYGFLLPRHFGYNATNVAALIPLLNMYANPSGMVYFWLTLSLTLASSDTPPISASLKNVVSFVEAPTVNVNSNAEFSAAAMFYNAMAFKPTAVTPVAPMAFKYLYGVTSFPTKGSNSVDINTASLSEFKANHINYVAYGTEGGIQQNMIYEGVTNDGFDYFNWWWTIDWVQINLNLDISNAIINGSNNPLAPLYYEQDGINTLLGVMASTMKRAGQLGMVLGRIVQTELTPDILHANVVNGVYAGMCNCNAVPFLPYSLMNPSDYALGEYDGLSTLFIPRRGFIHILVVVVASELVSV
jgi:hypothetical protein